MEGMLRIIAVKKSSLSWMFVVILAGLLGRVAEAEDGVDYQKQIKPILRERCVACHGALKSEGGLRLDTAIAAKKGGDSGAAIVAGNVAESVLLRRIASKDDSERMPPEGEHLTDAQQDLLRRWIEAGAKAPDDEQPEKDPRDHWAFKTPKRPSLPQVQVASGSTNPIDLFLAAEQQKHGLVAQGFADKRIWLRRVHLDLIGLPPTVAEQEAFLADTSADAYEKVVNRLLESPQYGERWGRHWMDIWRYSDAWGLGAEIRSSQKHIWHWRDWIVESLNEDKPYDQMLREMLAADELYPNDLSKLRANGFLVRHYFKFNRTSWLDETIEHTSKAMLGMTFNCAKCHDHKYDPISQVDYYSMRAIFEPYQLRTQMVPGVVDFEKDGIPCAFDCNAGAETFVHKRGDDRNPDKSRQMLPAVPAFLPQAGWKVEPITLPAEVYQPGLRPFVLEAYLKAAQERTAQAKAEVEAAKKKLAEAEEAANKLANTPMEKPAESPGFEPIVDSFSVAQPEVWETKTGKWAHIDGKLVTEQAGAERAALQLKKLPPRDFEVKLRYTPTGGPMWRSVGIAFDIGEGREALAYVSAFAGGPKIQVAYKQGGGDYAYPAEGAAGRKIELGQVQEVLLRVRGNLVNLSVGKEAAVAYRLPIERVAGALQLIAFDVSATFEQFEIKALPAEVVLVEAGTSPAPAVGANAVALAKAQLTLAEQALQVAELTPAVLKARAAADVAKHQTPVAENSAALSQEAAKQEKTLALAQAEEAIAKAEVELLKATADKREAAEKALAAAKAAIEPAKKALENPGDTYSSLIGAKKTLESNVETEESRMKPFPKESTGRRTALARWLTDPANPLPARVAVNHIWMRHFGRPLVPTVFDFGRKGTAPTHPELLDWLAVELVEHGWSMKHLHRLMVTSHAYRRTSSAAHADANTVKVDAENRYYWRANPIRMEAQIVRDSLLSLAGEIDLTMGGPSIPVNDDKSRRRSMYYIHSHNEHQKFLSIFDDANVLDCYRRAESILPQQALALENSELAFVMAEKISKRLTEVKSSSQDADFVREAFITILSSEPSEAEQKLLLEGLAKLTEAARQNNRPQPEQQARQGLVHALLNHNDFVTIR